MLTATIFLWVLLPLVVSQPPTEVAAPDIASSVDIERSHETAQITARDSDGEISAEMFIGSTRMDARG